MAIDMNLISLKDGGRFAMSWIAGTNPKALRSTVQRHQIYSVDVIEVCQNMIESLKIKEDKLSFRILFKLCFGTIRIYAEQVQHLYDVTLNFVCFNTFVMKQYSRKRLSSTVADKSNNKRIRLESSDDLDISSLLMETEIFNNYTEEKFKFPNELGHDKNSSRKMNTSTCIEIKQITIRHVSWDNPMPEEEDAFGDASQDERSILLSGLNDSLRRHPRQKRKPCYGTPESECSPLKRPCLINESVDDIRYDLSMQNDTISEPGCESFNQTIQESDKSTTDFNDNDLTQINFESTRQDNIFPTNPKLNKDVTENIIDHYTFEDSNDVPLPDILQEYISRPGENNVVDETSIIYSPNSSFSLDEIPKENTTFTERKRKLPHLIIDTYMKIPKTDLANIWNHCYDIKRKDHLASTKEPRKPIVFNKRIESRRLQSDKLLTRFNKNLKLRLQQNHDYNRQLIVEEILGDDFEEFKSLFKIKTSYAETIDRRKHRTQTSIEKIQQFEENNNNIIYNNNIKNISAINDHNNNIQIEEEPNHIQIESNGYNRYETQQNNIALNCSLDEIDPFAISFDFPIEAGNQRSEWGKEAIMTKLLFAWISEDLIVNMKSIIVGANRINAALAFHTLLDLSGQQYIEIVKDHTNSIESIKMGPEIIKKINESCG